MKVQCKSYVDSSGREVAESPWLRQGTTYTVLGLSDSPQSGKSYLIVSHASGDPLLSLGFFSDKCFDVVSDVMPAHWVRHLDGRSEAVMPNDWLEDDFFERLFDGDPSARHAFDREYRYTLECG